MNKEIHTEDVKRHIQCCIDTEDCLLCSFFKEGCDKSTFGKLMLNAVGQLEHERDAAIADLAENRRCETCKYYTPGYFCIGCRRGDQWEWRGVQKEVE